MRYQNPIPFSSGFEDAKPNRRRWRSRAITEFWDAESDVREKGEFPVRECGTLDCPESNVLLIVILQMNESLTESELPIAQL
jgi:hypothetical protein